jgi:hypothetical protein
MNILQTRTRNARGEFINHNFSRGDKMKTLMYGSVLVLLTLLALPTTSDAFSRRSSGPEIAPLQATTTPSTTGNSDAKSVPEPPVVLLMSVGVGLFALGYAISGFRKQS